MSILIKDCLYGHVALPALCVAFMDTPEFQRLRRIRQLGVAHYAFPGANHNRFEHCIGASILAGRFVNQLQTYVQSQQLPIPYSTEKLFNPRTKDLIQLAALYHDIGHSAYSHLFDTFLGKEEINEEIPDIYKLKDHEDRSIYFLLQVNARLQLLTKEEEEFIAHCIIGEPQDGEPSYLYEIVAGYIDVDRMDYLNRDAYHCGMPGFQVDYIILNAGISNDGHIAFRKKIKGVIKHMFDTRKRMFKIVYHHHTVLKISKMYLCMIKRVWPKILSLGEMIDDYNVDTLLRSLPETKDIMNDLDCRRLNHDCGNCSHFNYGKFKYGGGTDDVSFF